MIDADDEALLDTLSAMADPDVRALAASRWSTSATGSLLLALLERLAPHDVFVSAALADLWIAAFARVYQGRRPTAERTS